MNATFELVPPRGTIVSASGPRWFDAAASEAGTVAEGDWLFRSEAELHRPDRNSARAGWGHAYRKQTYVLREMPLVLAVGPNIVATCRYYGRSANSTAEPFGFAVVNYTGSGQAVLNYTGSGQFVVYQMRGSRGESPASTDVQILGTLTDTLAAELQELRGLSEGWDGEAAAAPIPDAINDALSFVRAAGDLAARLEPTLHVDGSVILEVGDGSEGSLRFRGDHTIIYAIRGLTPGVARFDGKTVPKEISATLAAVS